MVKVFYRQPISSSRTFTVSFLMLHIPPLDQIKRNSKTCYNTAAVCLWRASSLRTVTYLSWPHCGLAGFTDMICCVWHKLDELMILSNFPTKPDFTNATNQPPNEAFSFCLLKLRIQKYVFGLMGPHWLHAHLHDKIF